jgi:hypothetical protein
MSAGFTISEGTDDSAAGLAHAGSASQGLRKENPARLPPQESNLPGGSSCTERIFRRHRS